MTELKYISDKKIRCDVFLSEKISNLSRTSIQKLIKGKLVFVNGENENCDYENNSERTFSKLIENNLLDDDTFQKLFDRQFCKETFGIQYALLQTNLEECVYKAGHDRH